MILMEIVTLLPVQFPNSHALLHFIYLDKTFLELIVEARIIYAPKYKEWNFSFTNCKKNSSWKLKTWQDSFSSVYCRLVWQLADRVACRLSVPPLFPPSPSCNCNAAPAQSTQKKYILCWFSPLHDSSCPPLERCLGTIASFAMTFVVWAWWGFIAFSLWNNFVFAEMLVVLIRCYIDLSSKVSSSQCRR